MKRKGAIVSCVLGATAILIAGFVLKDELLIEKFIWQLESEQMDSSLRATKRLGKLRATRATPALVVAMAREEPELAWECVCALAKICAREARGGRERRRPEGFDELDSDEDVDAAVDRAAKELGAARAEVRTQAAEKLVYLGERAFSRLVTLLQSPSATVREHSVEILKLRGASAVDPLCRVARDEPEVAIRTAAIQALGWIRERRAVPTLLESTGDPDRQVAIEAVRSLGILQDERAVVVLRETFTNASHELDLRDDAAKAILRIDRPTAITAIRAVARLEEDKRLRHRFESMIDLAPGTPWPHDLLALRQLTIDSTTLMGETFEAEEVGQLLAHAKSTNPDVSSYCVFALAALNERETVRRLTELKPRPASLYGIFAEEASPAALEFILEVLGSDDSLVRRRGAFGLGVAGGRWCTPLLIALLERENKFSGQAFFGVLQRAEVEVLGAEPTGEVEAVALKKWWQAHGPDFLATRSVPALRVRQANPTPPPSLPTRFGGHKNIVEVPLQKL